MPQQEKLDVVQHPTLGTLKFPHSMPFDERNQIIAEMETKPGPTDPQLASLMMKAKSLLPVPQRESDVTGAAVRGLKNVAMMPVEVGKQFISGAREGGGFNPATGGINVLKESVVRPMAQQLSMATDASRTPLERTGRALAGIVPLVGPYAATVGERLSSEAPLEGAIETGAELATGAGMAKLAPVAGAVTKKGFELTAKGTIKAGRALAGIDEGPILQEIAKQKAATFEVLLDNAETVTKNQKAYQAKVEAAKAEHAEAVRKVTEQNEAKFAQAVGAWQQKVGKQKTLATERGATESAIIEQAKELRNNAVSVEQAVRKDFNARYQRVYEKVGDATLDGAEVADAIKYAEENLIKGSPENIKIFRDILNTTDSASPLLADASVFQGAGQMARGNIPGTMRLGEFTLGRGAASSMALNPELAALLGEQAKIPKLTFSDGHGFYSELGKKLYGSDTPLPGDVAGALKHVRNTLKQQLAETADNAGMGASWGMTQADWTKFQSTFHDMRSLSRGGSPIARVLRAEDPGYITQPVTGHAAARAVKMLEDYKAFGAKPEVAQRLAEKTRRLSELPGRRELAKTIEPPVRSDKALPQFKNPPHIEAKLKEMPLAVDIQNLKGQKLYDFAERIGASGGLHPYFDLAAVITAAKTGSLVPLAYPIGRRIVARILESETVKRSLTKPTARELEAAKVRTP